MTTAKGNDRFGAHRHPESWPSHVNSLLARESQSFTNHLLVDGVEAVAHPPMLRIGSTMLRGSARRWQASDECGAFIIR